MIIGGSFHADKTYKSKENFNFDYSIFINFYYSFFFPSMDIILCSTFLKLML